MADWYDGWMGRRGGFYHRRIAVPTTLSLLRLKRGESLLDVGSGSGVLARRVSKLGASYVGLELSPRLVALARERHGAYATFLTGDARCMPAELNTRRFDAAVFLLSIQDMDPLDQVIEQTAKVLRRGGRLVIFMVHPCFRIPRQSGWWYDDQRKLHVRRIDRYLSPLDVSMGRTISFHRPLETYVSALSQAGLAVDRLLEIPDEPAWARRQDRTINDEIPLFLALRGVVQ